VKDIKKKTQVNTQWVGGVFSQDWREDFGGLGEKTPGPTKIPPPLNS